MTRVKVINRSGQSLPEYATPGAAGLDLRACLDQPVGLAPLQRAIIPTGLFLEIPAGMEAQVRPRSGLAARSGITVLNAPGTIDSDYRGEVAVILINLSDQPFVIHPGDRIAQLVLARHEHLVWEEQEDLAGSARGSGGFGSTGAR